MNTPNDPRFLEAAEREWALQEEALRRERLRAPAEQEDARTAEYRLIARALRHPPMEALPADFAAQVAARAQAAADADDRLERLLQRGLLGVMAFAALVVAGMYGASWWPAFAQVLPSVSGDNVAWIATTAVGVGLTWWSGRVVERIARERAVSA